MDIASLLSVDPGSKKSGWAYFVNGFLQETGFDKMLPACKVDLMVIEKPKVYRTSKQNRKDPNSLITLAIAIGRQVEYMQSCATKIELILPQQWKGNRTKEIGNYAVMESLNAHEKSLIPHMAKSSLHNVQDAIGIGLWKLGRYK